MKLARLLLAPRRHAQKKNHTSTPTAGQTSKLPCTGRELAPYALAKLHKTDALFTMAAAAHSHRLLPDDDGDDASAHCAGPGAIHTSAISDSSMVADSPLDRFSCSCRRVMPTWPPPR